MNNQQPIYTSQQSQPIYTSNPQPQSVQPPVYQPTPPYQQPKRRVPLTPKATVFAAVFLVLSVLAIDFGLFGGFNLGYSVAVAAIAIALCIYASMNGRFTVIGGYYTLCSVAISAAFTVYNGGFTKFIQFFAVWILLAMALLDFTKSGVNPKGSWRSGIDVLRVMLVTPFERMGIFIGSATDASRNNSPEKKRLRSAILGAVCAVPALFIILPLLVSSDAAFEKLISQTFLSNLPRLIGAIILGAVLFVLLFTAVFAASKKIVAENNENGKGFSGNLNAVGANSFLSVISVVYAVYLLSQLGYFFGAFSGLLPENFTVAEYARRGFFEMTVICAINLLMVGLVLIFTKRGENGDAPASTRGLCMFIMVFSLAIIATVCAKLGLYMSNFGLTKLRVYTTLFSVMLAIVFVFVIIRLFIRRFPYFRACAVLIATLGVAVSVVDVNSYIAYYNYEAYNVGILKELDAEYFGQLGDAGVPYLVELLDEKEFKEQAADELYYMAYDYGDIDYEHDYYSEKEKFIPDYNDNDFRSYNMARIKAGKLI